MEGLWTTNGWEEQPGDEKPEIRLHKRHLFKTISCWITALIMQVHRWTWKRIRQISNCPGRIKGLGPRYLSFYWTTRLIDSLIAKGIKSSRAGRMSTLKSSQSAFQLSSGKRFKYINPQKYPVWRSEDVSSQGTLSNRTTPSTPLKLTLGLNYW